MIRGWRAYSLDNSLGGEPRVRGMLRAWPQAEMTAECLSGEATDSKSELCRSHLLADVGEGHSGHGCGIYIVPGRDDLDVVTLGYGHVHAGVLGWGITASYLLEPDDHPPIRSYRVECARIEYMLIRHPTSHVDSALALAAGLSDHYGVPVEVAHER